LDAYISSLSASGALIPQRQATPATRAQIVQMIERAQAEGRPHLAAAIYIAFKSASRVGDVFSVLKRRHFIHVTDTSIIIEWPSTKTTRRDPFRVSGWVVIVENTQPSLLRQVARTLQAMTDPDELLLNMSTTTFTMWMNSSTTTRDLTAHSIKRGAIGILINAAALGQLEPRLIALLAKHKDALHDFPATTLRYAPDKVQLARMLGSQKATLLL
jgi:hypothetical protein